MGTGEGEGAGRGRPRLGTADPRRPRGVPSLRLKTSCPTVDCVFLNCRRNECVRISGPLRQVANGHHLGPRHFIFSSFTLKFPHGIIFGIF